MTNRDAFLHKQIKCQCQQSSGLILLTVSCHQQQKGDHQQVAGVDILGQKLSQKAVRSTILLRSRLFLIPTLPILPLWRSDRRTGRFRRTRWRFGTNFYLLRSAVRHRTPSKAAVRLGNIAIIHEITCLTRWRSRWFQGMRMRFLQFSQPAWPAPAARSAPGSDRATVP